MRTVPTAHIRIRFYPFLCCQFNFTAERVGANQSNKNSTCCTHSYVHVFLCRQNLNSPWNGRMPTNQMRVVHVHAYTLLPKIDCGVKDHIVVPLVYTLLCCRVREGEKIGGGEQLCCLYFSTPARKWLQTSMTTSGVDMAPYTATTQAKVECMKIEILDSLWPNLKKMVTRYRFPCVEKSSLVTYNSHLRRSLLRQGTTEGTKG